MKNIEKIMTRDAIAQLLADNGVNRETIVQMVQKSIDEKVEKAVRRVLHDTNLDYLVEKQVKKSLVDVIDQAVRRSLGSTSISIYHNYNKVVE